MILSISIFGVQPSRSSLFKSLPSQKFNSSPLKIGHPERKLIFQPSFFRGYVKFRGCNHFSKLSISLSFVQSTFFWMLSCGEYRRVAHHQGLALGNWKKKLRIFDGTEKYLYLAILTFLGWSSDPFQLVGIPNHEYINPSAWLMTIPYSVYTMLQWYLWAHFISSAGTFPKHLDLSNCHGIHEIHACEK